MTPATLALVATVLGAETRLRFVSSETAQVFRVVDQLSGWSAAGPKRFASAVKLTDADNKLLERHAQIRNRLGWQATHAAFVVESKLDEACALAVARKLLASTDAAAECEVLRAFAPRVREWVKARAAQLDAARSALTAPGAQLTRFAREAARFSASKVDAIEVFLVPSVEGADGAYTAGRIVLEVPPEPSDDPLLHELWHAFAGPHLASFQRALAGRPRLDVETLSEGIAYAVQPGLFTPPGARGALELTVGAALRSGEPTALMGSNRPLELAIALRPSLERAWKADTLDAYLPTAVAIYESLTELDKAALATPRSLLMFGDSISVRLPVPANTRRLDPELLKYPMVGAAIGIVLIGRGPEAVPVEFRRQFFESWDTLTATAAEPSGTIELPDRMPPVFLWWDRAPDAKERVEARVRASMFGFVARSFANASPPSDAGTPDAGARLAPRVP